MQIHLPNLTMTYDDTGGAHIPLVLIHGFPLDRTMWATQLAGLADAARVIAPDLRGLGGSTLPPDAVTIDTYADDLRALLDALTIQRAVIAGLSMGGYVAFAFYRQYASRVRALILADTKASPDSLEGKKGRDDNIALARAQGTAAVVDKVMPKMFAPSTFEHADVVIAVRALMSRQPVAGVAAALAAMRDRLDSTPILATINAPTLVITGADDALMPASDSEAMARAIPGARLAVIPGAGHLANLEQPSQFNRAIREFLQGL